MPERRVELLRPCGHMALPVHRSFNVGGNHALAPHLLDSQSKLNGDGESRTPTLLRELAPEASASASSATSPNGSGFFSKRCGVNLPVSPLRLEAV